MSALGWAAGAGVEYAAAPHWSVKLEYLYSRSRPTFASLCRCRSAIRPWISTGQYRPQPQDRLAAFGESADYPKADLTDPESDRWEIHGQTHLSGAGLSGFRAPYTGTNSLTPARQAQATWSNSLYLNARLWEGGEVYYNPELLQGFGLSDTVGLAGFSSGEAQKSNFPYPHYNTSRLYVRQTFGFGGEQEELASGQQQLAGKADVNRLTLQAGKFSVGDVFDGNSYAKDTRRDFMNWSIWAPGAFDYAADKLGLDLRHDRRAQPEELGVARRLFPDGRGIQLQQFRHPGLSPRPICRRTGDTLFAVLTAGQAAHHRLGEQRQFRQLPRHAG